MRFVVVFVAILILSIAPARAEDACAELLKASMTQKVDISPCDLRSLVNGQIFSVRSDDNLNLFVAAYSRPGPGKLGKTTRLYHLDLRKKTVETADVENMDFEKPIPNSAMMADAKMMYFPFEWRKGSTHFACQDPGKFAADTDAPCYTSETLAKSPVVLFRVPLAGLCGRNVRASNVKDLGRSLEITFTASKRNPETAKMNCDCRSARLGLIVNETVYYHSMRPLDDKSEMVDLTQSGQQPVTLKLSKRSDADIKIHEWYLEPYCMD